MRRLMTMSLLGLVLVVLVLPTILTRFFVSKPATPVVDGTDSLPISVYFPQRKEIEQMPLGEYLKGVVAAEMPAEFATEALKAQFVVARTYAVRRMKQFGGSGCPLNPKADACADHTTNQAYMNREETARKLGNMQANSLWKRLDQVQAATEGLVLMHGGRLIDPLYHSVSGTLTEDPAEYYGQPLPYLKPVDDRWGADSPKLLETRRFSLDELARVLSEKGKTVTVAAMAGKSPVQILSHTATKRVKSVQVGGVVLTGREFREMLGLRSTNFSVTAKDSEVIIHTVGYGHGIGMSQYGADGMARAGKTYEEILSYYYSGITITRLFGE